jgi:hypothetical protein
MHVVRKTSDAVIPVGWGSAEARHVSSIAASSDLLVRSASEGTEILDPATLDVVDELPADGRALTAMFIDSATRRMLGIGSDFGMRLYDLESRAQLGTKVDIGLSFFMGAALRPDGLELAVRTADGVAVWDLDPEHWMTAACEVAGRNLTRDEWDLYIGDLADYRPTCPEFPLPE